MIDDVSSPFAYIIETKISGCTPILLLSRRAFTDN
jgi:hypothetical protein